MSKFKIAFLLVFCLLGGFTGLAGIIAIGQGALSSGWPQAEGQILFSETAHTGGSARTRPSYKIKYAYTVSGQYFIGDRIVFLFDRGDVTQKSMPYAIGHRVPVFYNPDHPSDSVLLNGIQNYYLFVTGLGFVFFAFGWFGYRYIPRRHYNDR